MSALCSHINNNQIVLGDLFEDFNVDIRESKEERFEERFMVVTQYVESLIVCIWHSMIDAILVQKSGKALRS